MSLNFTGSTPLWIVLLFAAGLVCIIKGGDLFVDAAGWIAEASGIPKFIIGATIVSFATTLPEMLVSVFAALEGKILLILPDQDFFSGKMQEDLIRLMHGPKISYVSGGHLSTVLWVDDYVRTILDFLKTMQ